jgi:zinc-binding dehydrogenase
VRIPHADTSLYRVSPDLDLEAVVLLSDILPTAYECGVLNGEIKPGDTVAIVGAGPIGLAALLTAQLYSPSAILMIDLDGNRLRMARGFGATSVVNSAAEDAVTRVLALTEGAGVDLAIEAVGTPAAFDTCQAIVGAGGRIANIGVHGKPVQLHLEKLWDRNIALTTRLVDTVTTPLLLKLVQTGKLRPAGLVTHRFGLDDIMQAYDTFADAAKTSALKVVPDNIPETGDVVIHSSGSHMTPSYAIRGVPGPDQFGCATRGEAERVARSCARRCGVNLWFSEDPSGFTLLARFRGTARQQPRRTRATDGALAGRKPTPARGTS